MKAITESTLIPISFVIAIAYGIFLFGGYHNEVKANSAEISRFHVDNKEVKQTVKDIEARLIRIEALLLGGNRTE